MTITLLLLVSILLQLGDAQIYLPCYDDEISLPKGCICLNPQEKIVSCQSRGLTAIPNVTRAYSLNLENNDISSLPANAFAHVSGLKKVFLGNNKIETIYQNTFENSDIEYLDLSDNRLRAIPSILGNIQYAPTNLRKLKLSNNFISLIDDEAFKGQQNLRSLYLGGNPVISIQPDAWVGLDNLELLELSADGLDIMKIPTDNLQNITSLSITGAKPKRLDVMKPWFETMPNVLHLKLIGIGLRDTHLVKGQFPTAWKTQLQTLSLQGNELTTIPYNMLDLPALQELDFSRNMITKISGPKTTARLPGHIFKFNISNNVLTIVHSMSMLGLKNASVIDLSDNELDRMWWTASGIDENLRIGAVLYLGGNPWNCRCGAEWLKDLANRQVQHTNEHMTDYEINNTYRCSGGTNDGKLIRRVPMSVFDCKR